MKNSICLLALAVMLAGAGLVGAQEKKDGMMGEGMMGKGMMDKGTMGGHPMRSMMERSVVATSDGGVVIVMGNKLIKYDKNLNLVKEVEMKVDNAAMEKMMDGKKCGCMMNSAKGPEGNSPQADHEDHH